MDILYKFEKTVDTQKLVDLFKSVEWKSADYPEELTKAIQNSHKVITAFDGDRLVGIINGISDGHMVVYFSYVIVHPDYHGKKIGETMMNSILSFYEDLKVKVLMSYNVSNGFYKKLGFIEEEGKTIYIQKKYGF